MLWHVHRVIYEISQYNLYQNLTISFSWNCFNFKLYINRMLLFLHDIVTVNVSSCVRKMHLRNKRNWSQSLLLKPSLKVKIKVKQTNIINIFIYFGDYIKDEHLAPSWPLNHTKSRYLLCVNIKVYKIRNHFMCQMQ